LSFFFPATPFFLRSLVTRSRRRKQTRPHEDKEKSTKVKPSQKRGRKEETTMAEKKKFRFYSSSFDFFFLRRFLFEAPRSLLSISMRNCSVVQRISQQLFPHNTHTRGKARAESYPRPEQQKFQGQETFG
jgi:hypothetical protein